VESPAAASLSSGSTPPETATPARSWRWIAALWGFAEATFFFIVPDVFTSRVALTHTPRQAFLACAWAVLGALVGGHVLFLFAQINPTAAATFLAQLDWIPGISPPLIAATGDAVRAYGASAFFTSAFSGVPYKLCTLHAGLLDVSYAAFLALSVASRFSRFAAVTALALLCRYCFLRHCRRTVQLRVHAIAWTAFYGSYFYVMSH
jgi:membrane protein YqaA with SNARE-associated domain